jgi:hypothetical protein
MPTEMVMSDQAYVSAATHGQKRSGIVELAMKDGLIPPRSDTN